MSFYKNNKITDLSIPLFIEIIQESRINIIDIRETTIKETKKNELFPYLTKNRILCGYDYLDLSQK